ncbi:ATP-binding protein [Petroclostridium sp. X23]|uniref:sensor histidine kinase n=1 Tax=Petroclostridium sp. X23 TaxID=3045146 RepID=UPI0024AD7F29|nr:ATP-binding protein [Petroclostridium sp. X23]WHH57780.1 ATP-binding protein [Petroclostridium sp. X23]
MKKANSAPYLRQVLLTMLLLRLFIPLMVVALIAIAGAGYLGEKSLENHQNQVVQTISRIVDYHLEHGARVLDSIARVAETSETQNLQIFMKSTWEAYGYFETIYCLDKDNKITLMEPYDTRHTGLDMSNLPDFKEKRKNINLIISRPFISLSTGYPTVYLIRHLSSGGAVIGELNLNLFQKEIMNIRDNNFVFIMDQTGMLIAHPSSDLVKQQTNMSNLGIFNTTLEGKSNAVYSYNGDKVIGSAVRMEETGWIVVDQVSLYVFFRSYAWSFVTALLVLLIIWLALVWNLRKQLHRYVITPLEALTKRTHMLTYGTYSELNILSSGPTSFVELNNLLVDFQFMSNNLQLREDALRESEVRYRGLVDRLPIGLFRVTLAGEILDINPMLAVILAYPSEELMKDNIIKFLNESLINSELKQFTTDNVCSLSGFETQIKRYDGIIIWVQIDSHIVYDCKGKEQFFEGTIQDITQRKQTEDKIKEQQKLLFEAERQQREVLEKSLAMKDEFISLVSHEFKTPLNVIYSAIQLMECVYFDKIPERVQQLIGNIKQNTFRQLRLANNLLDITRMDSGHMKLNVKNVDIVFLSKVITESVELYAKQKNIKMYFESNVESKIIAMDEEKFERIILNLLSNAMKFTESGGRITVLLEENKKSNFVQIKVTDTGIGIPKEKREIIFEKFGQVDSNLSRQAEGTGIGLSLVKLLVGALGGTIEVESELGEGSTFIITLPVKEGIESETEVCLDLDDRLVTEIKVQFSDIYFYR